WPNCYIRHDSRDLCCRSVDHRGRDAVERNGRTGQLCAKATVAADVGLGDLRWAETRTVEHNDFTGRDWAGQVAGSVGYCCDRRRGTGQARLRNGDRYVTDSNDG